MAAIPSMAAIDLESERTGFTPNEQRSHAGPVTLKCNRDGLPALAAACGSALR